FFFNPTSTTAITTLSLHDALPIYAEGQPAAAVASALNRTTSATGELTRDELLDNITLYWLTNTGVSASRLYWEYKGGLFNAKGVDRKSTRLNSSHVAISYAVFCLK